MHGKANSSLCLSSILSFSYVHSFVRIENDDSSINVHKLQHNNDALQRFKHS